MPTVLALARPYLLLFFSIASMSACSSGAGSKAPAENAEPIKECEAFLTAYGRCLESLGPADIALARVEQTRAGLLAQLGQGEAARDALRQQCAGNLTQISSSCH